MKTFGLLLALLVTDVAWCQADRKLFKTIGGKKVFEIADKNLFIFEGGMMIDADGAPKAYHKDNRVALDFLGNAGKPGNWWALVTDTVKRNGKPIMQSATDPAPGYYISMTSLADGAKKTTDPTRYVNSSTVPYIAIPPKFSASFTLGDIALVVNKKNGKRCYAIFADTGPANKIGEGSIFLAEQLGIAANPKKGGTDKNVVYILFKKSGAGKVLTNEMIESRGKARLSDADIEDLIR
jgi:hypothetical protein